MLPMKGVWLRPLVGELRSHLPCIAAKLKKRGVGVGQEMEKGRGAHLARMV